MKNIYSKILITTIGLLVTGVFFSAALPARAEGPLPRIVVLFEQSPLFKDSNLLPGGEVTRYFQVTNNSGENQQVIIQAINFTQPIPQTDLSRVLTIEVKNDGVALYGSKGLNYFYTDGEIYLSDLASGQTAQYDVTVSFTTQSGNEWQDKTTGFDVLVGFKGEEGGTAPVNTGVISGTSTGSGGLPSGLSISSQSIQITTITPTNITVNWLTSYAATSQVIYALAGEAYGFNLSDNAGIPPLYGYPHSTPEDLNKIMAHSVTIAGLTPGTTYYYRTVSHGSLAISQEYSFTTPIAQAATEILPITEPIAGNDKLAIKATLTDKTRLGGSDQVTNQAGAVVNKETANGANVNTVSEGNVLGTRIVKQAEAETVKTTNNLNPNELNSSNNFAIKIIITSLILVLLGVTFILWKKRLYS